MAQLNDLIYNGHEIDIDADVKIRATKIAIMRGRLTGARKSPQPSQVGVSSTISASTPSLDASCSRRQALAEAAAAARC